MATWATVVGLTQSRCPVSRSKVRQASDHARPPTNPEDKAVPELSQRLAQSTAAVNVRLGDLAAELRAEGVEVCDLMSAFPDEQGPKRIVDAAISALRRGNTRQTSARGTEAFRRGAAAKLACDNGLHVDAEREIVATFGCKHGLMLALLAVIDPGDEVLIEDPCFVSYEPAIRFVGGVPVRVPLEARNRYRWTGLDLRYAITERTRAILYSSPQNPTGVVHERDDLKEIANVACEHDLVVIADEAYERTTWSGREHVSIATLPDMRERSIGLMSFSKSHSMGGWRIGFAYAPPAIARAMTVAQAHVATCPGSFTQEGAIEAFRMGSDDTETNEYWREWERRCDFVASELSTINGVTCEKPEGGFYVWVDIREITEDSEAAAESLLRDQHVAVFPGRAFGSAGDGHLRVTCVKAWDELREAVDRLQRGLGELRRGAASVGNTWR